jgi:hypothetical protein
MVWFVRKSSRGDWDKVTAETPEDLTFPADVLSDILDTENEISVWQVDDLNSPELVSLAAALHSPAAQNLGDVTFRRISDWRIKDKEQLGLQMQETRGDSVDSVLNKAKRHSVIKISTVGDAIRLAKALKEHPPLFLVDLK